jgi:hypothetical protein
MLSPGLTRAIEARASGPKRRHDHAAPQMSSQKLTQSLQRKSRQLCATMRPERLQQSTRVDTTTRPTGGHQPRNLARLP